MHYLIRKNVEPLGSGQRIEVSDIARKIAELSGRPHIVNYILRSRSMATHRGGNGRAYVATDRNAPGRDLYGAGFIVERVQ